jgi:hypothetical protein
MGDIVQQQSVQHRVDLHATGGLGTTGADASHSAALSLPEAMPKMWSKMERTFMQAGIALGGLGRTTAEIVAIGAVSVLSKTLRGMLLR